MSCGWAEQFVHFAKRLVLGAAITFLPSFQAQAIKDPSDAQLGHQWAICSQEASILQDHARTPEAGDALRQAVALFGGYAIAAAGHEAAAKARADVSRTYDAALKLRITSEAKQSFVSAWSSDAEERAERCRSSFAKHGKRFRTRVRALIEAERSESGAWPAQGLQLESSPPRSWSK